MLLPIEAPNCLQDFTNIHSLLLDVLKYLEEPETSTGLNETEFSNRFSITLTKTKKKRKHWLLRLERVKIALENIALLSKDERTELREVFEQDNKFWTDWKANPSYRLTIRNSSTNVFDKLRDLMIPLYEDVLLKTGFRDIEGLDERRITRKYFKEKHLAANQEHFMHLLCPACLGDPGIAKEGNFADLDHYFPKSLYPTLAVNMHNLVPVCMLCNQKMKRNRTPLHLDDSVHIPILLPYYQPDREFLSKLKLRITKGVLRNEIELGSDEPQYQVAVQNFQYAYNLGDTWSGRLERINLNLILLLKEKVCTPYTVEAVKNELIRIYNDIIKVVSTEVDACLTALYIRDYLIQNDSHINGLIKRFEVLSPDRIDQVTAGFSRITL